MARPLSALLASNFRSWLSARGFWLVVAAAFLPFILTGAWVATHQKDVSVTYADWTPDVPGEGGNMTLTATVTNTGKFRAGAFNTTLAVGPVIQNQLRPAASQEFPIGGLDPGESWTFHINWTARPGVYWFVVQADSDDDVSEIEEFNNQKPRPFVVQYKLGTATEAPKAPGNLTGGPASAPNADAEIVEVRWIPAELKNDGNATFQAVVANRGPSPLVNASVTIRIGQAFQNELFPVNDLTENVTLAPGESAVIDRRWDFMPVGAYWVEAYVNATEANHDPVAANNHQAKAFTIDTELGPSATPPDPPERLTIKRFYLQILSNLHLRILIPFIGLFYAAGVLSDEKDRGTLGYLLTRPISRWTIPITKFSASFLVAAVALTAGIFVTFALLFGMPGGNVGFLTTPLFVSLLSLFAYGSFFILLGVLVDRPYLVGIAWVIGWETVAGALVPWVQNLTLSHHLLKVTENWPLDKGLRWLPEGDAGMDALRNMLIASVAFLVAACIIMRRREFDI